MKKNKLVTRLILFLTVFAFTSCEVEPIDSAINLEDMNTSSQQGVGAAVFKADFNGKTWNADDVAATLSENFMVISGIKINGEGFGFLINASATGTYAANQNYLAYSPANTEYGYDSVNVENPDENTGYITITNIDKVNKTISGNFQFKGYWSNSEDTSKAPIQFTNGVFTNIPYITQAETGDTFYAKVDGKEFVDVDLLTFVIGSGSTDWISIGAQDSNLNGISVDVRNDVKAGNTYDITGNINTDFAQAYYTIGDSGEELDVVSGSVTIISKTDTRIKGTFHFIATNGTITKTITEGSFDVEY